METDKTQHVSKIETRLRTVEKDVRKIKATLEMTSPIDPLNWLMKGQNTPFFIEFDKQIIQLLLYCGENCGLSTTELAKELKIENIDSGRVMVWRRLKQIAKRSKARTGYPIVITENKRWHMNYDEFSFVKTEDKKEDF